VRLIVPLAPAGASDITARLIGQWLSERLGQQFVIDNRPGGGGKGQSRKAHHGVGWNRRLCAHVMRDTDDSAAAQRNAQVAFGGEVSF
jgi:Tripartite tricarboxylate transporter family receptor